MTAAGRGRNAERDFRGEKRSNETHASTTDPDARLYKKADGQPSRLCFVGTALMENRNGLVVDGRLTRASGVSECLAAIDLADEHIRPAARSPATRGSTPPTSWPSCANAGSRRMSRRMPTTPARRGGDPISTGGRPAMPATPPARNPQAHRGDLRLAEDRGGLAQVAVPWPRPHRARLPSRPRRLQPRPNAEAPRLTGARRLRTNPGSAHSPLIGPANSRSPAASAHPAIDLQAVAQLGRDEDRRPSPERAPPRQMAGAGRGCSGRCHRAGSSVPINPRAEPRRAGDRAR